MQSALVWTAFIMGLAGGTHCLTMCGALCGGLNQVAGKTSWTAVLLLQIGRLLSYCVAGAAAAAAMQSLAWLTQQSAILRPVWTLFHVAILLWGVTLVLLARQPVWAGQVGRVIWARLQKLQAVPGGVLMAGCLWAFIPCGLLYSALLTAALSGDAFSGAIFMIFFAIGSGSWLVLGPLLWRFFEHRINGWRQEWGTRIAGVLLCGVAATALWSDMAHRIAEWCA